MSWFPSMLLMSLCPCVAAMLNLLNHEITAPLPPFLQDRQQLLCLLSYRTGKQLLCLLFLQDRHHTSYGHSKDSNTHKAPGHLQGAPHLKVPSSSTRCHQQHSRYLRGVSSSPFANYKAALHLTHKASCVSQLARNYNFPH